MLAASADEQVMPSFINYIQDNIRNPDITVLWVLQFNVFSDWVTKKH